MNKKRHHVVVPGSQKVINQNKPTKKRIIINHIVKVRENWQAITIKHKLQLKNVQKLKKIKAINLLELSMNSYFGNQRI